MNKVHYDSSKFYQCSTILNSALQGFEKSIDAASGLDVPDFAYQGWLNSLPGVLEGYKMKCKDDQEWADINRSKIDDKLAESEQSVNSIEVQTGLVRELSVN